MLRCFGFMMLVLLCGLPGNLLGSVRQASAADVSGTLQQWHTVTLTWEGPQASETLPSDTNPFTDYRMEVTLTDEKNERWTVPGFFAADGKAAESSATQGDRWRVRFSPPTTGRWNYTAKLMQGNGIAIADDDQGGTAIELKDASGSFTVSESRAALPDFRAEGHLRYVGERYLKFAGSNRYFLKAGTDSPETLLGYADFDGTYHDRKTHPVPAPGGIIELPSLSEGLHRYAGHVQDWRSGDATWHNDKGKGIIGGMNYLSDHGVNSVYFLTMNVNGDGRNVWPWTGPWNHDRFDCSKLDQWEIVFEHMQRRGIAMHVVLQETENDHMLDGGSLGPNRKLYLREMVARFAHHPAVFWNLGEENTQTVAQQTQMAEYLRAIDPYDHPIVIHNDHWSPRNLRDTFDPLLGKPTIDGTAIQDFHWNDVHAQVKHYVDASSRAGKQWFVCSDEMGGANWGLPTDADEPDHYNARSKGLWGNLMAGGAGVEWYFGWQNNSPHSDLSAETWRTREKMWDQSRWAIDFFRDHLPFHEMKSADHLALAYSDYCFAKPGEAYCIYLFSGGSTRLDLEGHSGAFSVRWFDPRNGGDLQTGSVATVWGPSWIDIGEPPPRAGHRAGHSAGRSEGLGEGRGEDDSEGRDWVALVKRIEPTFAAGKDGAIVVEAEHFKRQHADEVRRWHVLNKGGDLPPLAGAGEATTYVRSNLSAAAKASGRTFLRCLPDTRTSHADKLINGENFSSRPGKLAILDYDVRFDKPGRYYVWVRAFSTNSEDNGIHVGIDGTWPESGQRMQWCDGKRSWRWECAQRTKENHCGEAMQIFLDVPQAGVHTVSFSMREDGFTFDQFALSRDREYRPSRNTGSENVVAKAVATPVQAMVFPDCEFPDQDWQTGTPKSQGYDSAKLAEAMDYLQSHCFEDGLSETMLIHRGVVFFEGDNTTKRHNIWSCSKSFTSTALGLLIADGKCNLDTRAATILPELKALYPDVTLRHFTTMTSGYSARGRSRWDDENSDWSWTPYDPEAPLFAPGTAYAYWDEAQMMLGRCLTKIAGQPLNELLAQRVYEPIGMGPVTWGTEGEVDGIAINNGCTNVTLNARQFARFGLLFLNRGNWNGQQLIPADWIDAATQTQVPASLPIGDTDRSGVLGSGSYGFNWWTSGGKSAMPLAPPKTYYASGLNHNVLCIVPEWDLVIVRMGVDGNPTAGKHHVYNDFIDRLGKARIQVK